MGNERVYVYAFVSQCEFMQVHVYASFVAADVAVVWLFFWATPLEIEETHKLGVAHTFM